LPGLAQASVLERPAVLGGSGVGLLAPALAPLGPGYGVEGTVVVAPPRRAVPAAPPVVERVRRHPYVRLALNGSFSALWVGQLISLFGDRIHQVALAFLVLGVTNSPLAVGLVFLAATVPNLLFGPIAGTFVDRWDHKEVMVVSDLLRASVVLLIPIAAVVNIYLAYPLVFLLTTISIFFRPARTAIIPRIVRDDELLTANSAIWIGETLADVIGYPVAGLFVAFVGAALPLAFWIDAATYVASALLIATMAVPPMGRAARAAANEAAGAATGIASLWAGVREELLEGWHFLRGETVLLANTFQGVVGQFANGVLLALTPFYAQDVLQRGAVDGVAAYAFLETAIGIGSLIGGFVIGLIGARLAKGRLVIAGYTIFGLCMAGLALAGNLPVALALMMGTGIANMIYIIPSQTLFQERTPAELIGRVVGFRFSLVFGSLTVALAVSGALAQVVGVTPVIALFGLVTTGAGLAGLLIPAVRDA
jgi:MFS family permease